MYYTLLLTACALALAAMAFAETPESVGKIVMADPALKKIVPVDARIEKLATGFRFTEGPIWIGRDGGALLFSDIPNNAIMRWTPDGKVSVFRKPSGNANGHTLDREGRLVSCEHSNRRVSRTEKDGTVVTLADRYQGKRLNSPNDAVYRSDGSLYFTDPPYGLQGQDQSPEKELAFNGVYRLSPDGKLTLLTDELDRPNGLAFSPDEKHLYVANSAPNRKLWRVYDVKPDGSLDKGRTFADVTKETTDGLPDGMKVDRAGNVYATGPGGVWVFDPQGKHLGALQPTEVPANCHWGDADGKTLYMTARTGLYRIRLNIAGLRP